MLVAMTIQTTAISTPFGARARKYRGDEKRFPNNACRDTEGNKENNVMLREKFRPAALLLAIDGVPCIRFVSLVTTVVTRAGKSTLKELLSAVVFSNVILGVCSP